MQDLITDWSQVPILAPIEMGARVIGISRSTFYALINSGEIRTKRVGGRRFIPKVELQRYCEGSR